MAQIGKLNTLKVVKELDFGVYLDGEAHGEILLPRRYVPIDCKIDDMIEVFIYLDSEDRIIATTEKPFAIAGEFACLDVIAMNTVGAFLNWGLPKDLLVPFREQKLKMEKGKSYIVYIYIDKESNRIAASTKLDNFLDKLPPDYREGQEVDLLVCNPTDIGFRAIINGSHWGILYKNEVFQKLVKGQKIKGFIKKIRDDKKIDLCLQKDGFEKVDKLSEKIIAILKEQNGFIKVTDKSPAKIISDLFGVSKKTYKKSVGALYKKKLIAIEENGIRLITQSKQ
ncbi:MAG: GntR family transcriptional regulator [Bacteroidia bacterium]|nr:GntR family transcriptional regulator [Bacteroidia bacterium]